MLDVRSEPLVLPMVRFARQAISAKGSESLCAKIVVNVLPGSSSLSPYCQKARSPTNRQAMRRYRIHTILFEIPSFTIRQRRARQRSCRLPLFVCKPQRGAFAGRHGLRE